MGDPNYDGKMGFCDLLQLAQNYGSGGAATPVAEAALPCGNHQALTRKRIAL
jgi:hypothetical protein